MTSPSGETRDKDAGLVLSLFPGIGLLDMAFEEEGFCVVRGPDLLWGGDVRRFHIPAGRFDGIIGGPPCQLFTRLRHLVPTAGQKHGNMIPEFERCVTEGQPNWFIMENVPDAPEPCIPGYTAHCLIINNRWFGEAQERKRRISFGSKDGRRLRPEFATFETPEYSQAVTSSLRRIPVALVQDGHGGHRPKRGLKPNGARPGPDNGPRAALEDMLRLQGLEADFFGDDSPFTMTAKRKMVGNGVPLAMGRSIAKAVRIATRLEKADGK